MLDSRWSTTKACKACFEISQIHGLVNDDAKRIIIVSNHERKAKFTKIYRHHIEEYDPHH